LHIRLARTDPDFAHQHILQRQRILAADRQFVGTTCCEGIEFDGPFAIRACLSFFSLAYGT
jgi:hypothetical protein